MIYNVYNQYFPCYLLFAQAEAKILAEKTANFAKKSDKTSSAMALVDLDFLTLLPFVTSSCDDGTYLWKNVFVGLSLWGSFGRIYL